MRALKIREAMVEAAERWRKAGSAPERYRWIAVWWRLSALESMTPGKHRKYARSQMALAADMERRPHHYAAKPAGMTDWLHSGLATRRASAHDASPAVTDKEKEDDDDF